MSGIKLPNGMELVFAPGCFDNFEGTQEELDEMIKEITEKFTSGEALMDAEPIDLSEIFTEEELAQLMDENENLPITNRTLQ